MKLTVQKLEGWGYRMVIGESFIILTSAVFFYDPPV